MLDTDQRTIADFGEQWTRNRDNAGHYASADLLANVLGPLMSLDEIRGLRVADIGSGTGRIVNMLLDAGAAEVVAVEPSDAFEVLVENTAARSDRVRYVHAMGEKLDPAVQVDLVTSIGVLHHVTDPGPIVEAAHRALVPGGRFVAWLYGRENNGAYLAIVLPMRRVTSILPHWALAVVSGVLGLGLDAYIPLARRFPLPLAGYVRSTLGKFTPSQRRLVIYDQLNPAHARYYTQAEARALAEDAGFEDVRLHHRDGYSWTVMGVKR